MSYLDMDAVQAGIDAASNVATDVSQFAMDAGNSSWWDTGIEYANTAFEWMNDYPEATNLLAGVAGGVGQYLTSQQQLEQQQKFAEEQWNREREARRINPGEIKGYGSHVATAKGGLLTNGMIVPEDS